MQSVLDASVVLKLLVEEPGSSAEEALLDRPEQRVAPDWIALELAGALWNKVKYSQLLAIHAERSLEDFPRFLHGLVPSRSLVDETFRLSIRLQHPVYGCMYLALAIAESAPLITADKGFHQSCVKGRLDQHVELLTW